MKLSSEKEEALLLCLPRLRARTVSTQQVASAIGVSKNTVAQNRDGLRGRATLGRPTVLTQAEELKIVEAITRYEERGAALKPADITRAVQLYVIMDVSDARRQNVRETFRDGRPGKKWVRGFMQRHPQLSKVKGRSLDAVRAAATNPENIARLFALIKIIREEKNILPRNVFNCDECGIDTKELKTNKQTRYMNANDGRHSRTDRLVPGVAADDQSMTSLPLISADSVALPPTFVVRGTDGHVKKRRPAGQPTGAWEYLTKYAPPDSMIMFRTPAGLDRKACCRFVATKVFATLRPDEPKMLIIDGCPVHISFDALDALARANLEVIFLPANTTQATRQLDVAMFRGFKGDVRDELAARVIAMDVPNNKSKKITVWDVMEYASRAYERAFISSKIKASFLETGVEPWDPEKLERQITCSDSMARVRKPEESLARLAVRLAPAMAKERNDLKWERGTMRTTQSVFMDACNMQWLAEAELAKEEEEQDKAEKKAARDAARQKKKEVDAEKAKEVVAQRAAMKKKKEDEASEAEQRVAPPGRGWCRGTARGEPGSGGYDPHRHTGLVSPWATGIAPTLGVGPCSACNPAWRRAAAAGGPARGGGYAGRRALPRSHATGRHVPPRQAGVPGPDSPSSLLTALGDLSCIVFSFIGWSAARANSHWGNWAHATVSALLGRRATTVGGTVVAGK